MKALYHKTTDWADRFFVSRWCLLGVLGSYSLVVLLNLDRESLWLDEIYSAHMATKVSSLHDMFHQYIFNDVHPPFYQLLLYYWSTVFGDSDFVLRFLSYCSVLIGLCFSYLLLDKYISTRTASVYVAMSAFTPAVLYYSEEARSYALLYALASVLSILFMILAERAWGKEHASKNLLFGYFFTGLMICYTHFFGYLLFFSLSATLLGICLVARNRKTFVSILLVSAAIAALSAVWLVSMFAFGNIESKTNGNFWIDNNYQRLIRGLKVMLVGGLWQVILSAVLLFLMALPISTIFSGLRKNGYLFIPILGVFTVAHLIGLHTPVTTPRNLIIILPLVLLLFSVFIARDHKKVSLLFVVYIALLISTAVPNNARYKKQDWRGASNYIATHFDAKNCRIPARPKTERVADQNFLVFLAYYLGDRFSFSQNGPEVQDNCDLVFFDGHTTRAKVEQRIAAKNITADYEVLDFKSVYVVVKK